MSNVELNWKETLAVGKIGRTGVETHAITCEVAVKNEGMPWQSTAKAGALDTGLPIPCGSTFP
jgi:hypothetical protein